MKKYALLFVFCMLFWGIKSMVGQTQDEAPPPFYVVFEEFVAPSDLPAFKALQDKAIKLWIKHEMDVPIWAYQNNDNAYYWVIPLNNFAGLDGLYQKMMTFSETLKEKEGFDGDQEFRDLTTGRQLVLSWSNELSYHPAGNYGQTADKSYIEWMFCYLKAGHEKEVAAAAKKYIEFYNSIDESYEWDIYMTMIGYDTPMWIFMTRSKNAIEMRQLEADLWAKYNTELEQLWLDFSKHVRKFENKTGWFLPKWSINVLQ